MSQRQDHITDKDELAAVRAALEAAIAESARATDRMIAAADALRALQRGERAARPASNVIRFSPGMTARANGGD